MDSYEALIRMIGRDGAPVPAGDFIPVAEELGLVRDLDRRVLELASVALRRAPALRLAVNISGMSVSTASSIESMIPTGRSFLVMTTGSRLAASRNSPKRFLASRAVMVFKLYTPDKGPLARVWLPWIL